MDETVKLNHTCVICDQEKNRGIHLYTKFICLDCERKVISTSTSDPDYPFYVKKLKSIHTPPLYS
ncbi:anti-sigma-G factor [Bacillus subtilis]|nr:anti-sigma-G factor [Bacillus subtilis]WGD65094.1 anti-sigma-G factor [Bacillus subtilis]WGD69680.1 anti-sigma-G factor [Bacillus subtilis]WGD73183.1 anti-sigma-G factor [Bacillus subtilis]WGD81915.1 anti-sigma-G factor [Bacillus subtilis]